MFKVGIPKEIFPAEKRVAATPATVGKIIKLGAEVLIEAGAGEGAHFQDGTYVEVGARVVPTAELWAESDSGAQGAAAHAPHGRQARG